MRQYNLSIKNNSYEVLIKEVTEEDVTAEVNGVEYIVAIQDIKDIAKASSVSPFQPPEAASQVAVAASPAVSQQTAVPAAGGDDDICSPMPGQIIAIHVNKGDKVLAGQKLMVLEAMKLENAIVSKKEGVVAQVFVKEGDIVNQNQALLLIK